MRLLRDTQVSACHPEPNGKISDRDPTPSQRLDGWIQSQRGQPVGTRHQVASGQTAIRPPLESWPERPADLGIDLILIDDRHRLTIMSREPPTRDPFDRVLPARRQVEALRRVTVDRALVSHALTVNVTHERPPF